MAERYFTKDGKKVSYSALKNVYGNTTDAVIKRSGLEEMSTDTQTLEAEPPQTQT